MRVVILALLLTSGCGHPSVQKTASPDGVYHAEITTNAKASVSGDASQVELVAHKNDQEYLKGIVLDENEYSDNEWYNAHPDNIWVNNSILRFGWKKDFSDTDPDLVYIRNETDKAIKYLKVNARDIFLLIDFPAKSCVALKSGHQGWQSWLTIDGQFDDGRKITWHGVNFFHKDEIKKTLRYCITISEMATKIESPDIEGYYGPHGNRITAPKSPDCLCHDTKDKK